MLYVLVASSKVFRHDYNEAWHPSNPQRRELRPCLHARQRSDWDKAFEIPEHT
jgi:hypothetical protein